MKRLIRQINYWLGRRPAREELCTEIAWYGVIVGDLYDCVDQTWLTRWFMQDDRIVGNSVDDYNIKGMI